MHHWRSLPQRRPSADSAGLTHRLYQVQASLLPGTLTGLVSEDEIGRTGNLFPRPTIYLRNAGGMERHWRRGSSAKPSPYCAPKTSRASKRCLEGTDLAVCPRDNRQRGRLLPADRPNTARLLAVGSAGRAAISRPLSAVLRQSATIAEIATEPDVVADARLREVGDRNPQPLASRGRRAA